MRRRARLATLLAPLAALGCEALLTDPAPAPPSVAVSFTLHAVEGDGAARAFDRVDRVFLRFVRADSAARDTVVPLANRDGVARARLVLDTRERVAGLGIHATLAAGAAPLFQGSRVVRIEVGRPTSAEIPLDPIAHRIRADRPTLALQVGDTARLGSAVLFATGDTLSGTAGSWRSDAPAVVFVSQGGVAVGRSPGDTRLVVRFGELADTVLARVQARR